MNLPNKLTILRIVLVPVCLLLTWYEVWLGAAAMFALACLTDTLDGHIARKRHLITNFGKFADPIADKILTVSMMVLLCEMQLVPVFLPLTVIIRELMVDGLRLLAVEKGEVVAAGLSGKIKTVVQMITILLVLLGVSEPWCGLLCLLVCALTIYSGGEYFWKLRHLFRGDFGHGQTHH